MFRYQWTQQPQYLCGINYNYANSLHFALTAKDAGGLEHVYRQVSKAHYNFNTCSSAPGLYGNYFKSSTIYDNLYANVPALFFRRDLPNSSLTYGIVSVFEKRGTLVQGYDIAATDTNNSYGIYLHILSTGHMTVNLNDLEYSTTRTYTSSEAVPDGFHVVICTFNSSNQLRVYLDGVLIITTDSAIVGGFMGASYAGYAAPGARRYNTASFDSKLKVYANYGFKNPLSAVDISNLSINPWQIFQP